MYVFQTCEQTGSKDTDRMSTCTSRISRTNVALSIHCCIGLLEVKQIGNKIVFAGTIIYQFKIAANQTMVWNLALCLNASGVLDSELELREGSQEKKHRFKNAFVLCIFVDSKMITLKQYNQFARNHEISKWLQALRTGRSHPENFRTFSTPAQCFERYQEQSNKFQFVRVPSLFFETFHQFQNNISRRSERTEKFFKKKHQ